MLIWGFVRNLRYSIFLKDLQRVDIQASKGLRQEDPLSLFLFSLVVDVLSWLILKGVEGNIIESFRIGANEVALSHLQFADDTMLFYSVKEESFFIFNHIVGFFEDMSGLKINRNKCQILGINNNLVKLRNCAEVFGCEVGLLPSYYLRLPLGGNPRATMF